MRKFMYLRVHLISTRDAKCVIYARKIQENQAWVEEIADRWSLVREQKRGLRVQSPYHRVGVSSDTRRTTPTPRTTSSLLGTLNRQTHGRFS